MIGVGFLWVRKVHSSHLPSLFTSKLGSASCQLAGAVIDVVGGISTSTYFFFSKLD